MANRLDMDFVEFWTVYPRKIARMEAERAWHKLTGAQHQEAIAGIERYKRWLTLRGTESAYILHASTYLNQQRWTDEYETQEEAAPQAQWWKSEPATLAMAKKVGVTPGSGEGWDALRDRIRKQIVRAA